jgi:hypothetical protein
VQPLLHFMLLYDFFFAQADLYASIVSVATETITKLLMSFVASSDAVESLFHRMLKPLLPLLLLMPPLLVHIQRSLQSRPSPQHHDAGSNAHE